jgi:ferredoxin-NADP reductase
MESRSHHVGPKVHDVNRAPAPKWQEGEVIGVVVETPETNTLKVRLSEPAGYLAGQYFNIRIPVEGRPRPIQRAYSVGSSPTEGLEVVDFGIRETEGGLVSPVLVRNTPIGTKLEVRGPYGDFTWQEMDQGPVLLIGAGSGVVPLKSIIRYALDKGTDVKMALLYSSKSAEYVIYDEELREILSKAPWLRVYHTFTRDASDATAYYHRRIDKEMIAEVYGQLEPKLAFICGPPEMVEDAESALIALGMDPKMVKSEKYD